jgi:hypothetical protein
MKGFIDTSVLVPVIYGDHVHHQASLALFIRFDKSTGCCDEYADAFQSAAALGIVGGGIYDAMLAHCGLKAQAESIFTWNHRHYAQCGPEITSRLRTP